MDNELLTLTSEIVASHVANNSVHANDVPALIRTVAEALAKLGTPDPEPEQPKPTGAVTARKSLADPAKIISMIDGKPYTSLKRHIGKHGYTPESYRETFGLPANYPMVAPSYSEQRRSLAQTLGLGRKRVSEAVEAVAEPVVETAKKVVRTSRKAAAETISEPVKIAVRRGRKAATKAIGNE